MSSSLIAHSPKFASKLVTLDGLRNLPEPLAIGSRHKPVPHHVLVAGLMEQVEKRDYQIVKSQYALGAKGNALFGVMDLQPKVSEALVPVDRGMSLGFRSSVDSSLSIQAVAGTRVTVCDNLMLSGSMIAIKRKSTTHLDLGTAIVDGFDKFLVHEQRLTIEIERLTVTKLSDSQAKEMIFDLFNASVVPVRLFGDVARFYFKPTDEATDCQPRSLWGLNNAFTRAMKDLTPASQFRATLRLGRAFNLETHAEGEVVEADDVTVVDDEG